MSDCRTPSSVQSQADDCCAVPAVAQINAGINAEQCACDIRNPQGSCCLGNVTKTVKRIQQEQASVQKLLVG